MSIAGSGFMNQIDMSAWGTGFFDNDVATDWVSELEETGHDAIQHALRVADETDIELADAQQAVAAAVVVLALAGSTFKGLPEELDDWLEGEEDRPETIVLERALEAVQAVLQSSELRDYWEEEGELKVWARTMRKLIDKLDARVG